MADIQDFVGVTANETWVEVSSKQVGCLADNGARTSASMLILNQDSIELVISKPKHQLKVICSTVNAFFEELLWNRVNEISSGYSCHISSIDRIRQYFTTNAGEILAHALVTSRLDYGNALQYHLPSTRIERPR